MYNHSKTRSRGLSARNFRGRRQSGFKKPTGVSTDKYINKTTEPVVSQPNEITITFKDFHLDEQVYSRVVSRGYVTPTPIQAQAIPEVMSGKDVIGLAETGTGKTAAFLLPLLHKMRRNYQEKVLIIVPTRELAVQINDELRLFANGLPFYSAVLIGGSGYGQQIRDLKRRPHFIIGTPGRLKDHLQQRTLRLNDVHNLVVDEADRLVEMGFINDVRAIISELPSDKQTLFFSATMMDEVKSLVHSFLKNPVTISVKKRDTSANVDQDVIRYTDQFHKVKLLHDLLIQPDFGKVLIFGRTKHGVEKLAINLQERGFSTASIHGNKNQNQRQRALNMFKNNEVQILVATDVAARGLDIPNVTHVINFDEPENYADYIHRIGRTGRADKKGSAITFIR